MSQDRSKWDAAKADILASLNIVEEYKALGVVIVDNKPTAKGWLSCRAVGREDKNPSAGIHVGEGQSRGRYKDFAGGGKTINLFDFAAMVKGVDYMTALKHYAKVANVNLPTSDDDSPSTKFDRFPATFSALASYCKHKPGVTIDGLKRLGVFAARWPRGVSLDHANAMFGFGMYGTAALSDYEPTGFHFVPENPRGNIRKYRGKDEPEQLLKTMTLGTYGLMNEYGLSQLDKAKVVVILEGISDLACAQSICPDDTGVVVLSAGGCSYHPSHEWDLKRHFAGKEVWLCFDVGDKDNAGQDGAKVWLKHLLELKIATRNVLLPIAAEEKNGHGHKMDFRQWINEGHSWAEFVEYAQTFDVLTLETATELMSHHDVLLKKLGLIVIGEHESSYRIEVFSEPCRKTATIGDIDNLTGPKLAQLIGPERVDEHVHLGKDAVPGKANMSAVRLAISSAASRKHFSGESRLGAGVWKTNGDLILVQSREVSIFDGSKLTKSEVPFYHGKLLDLSPSCPQWFDHGSVARMITEATRNPVWAQDAYIQSEKLFGNWYWKHSSAPSIITALITATYLQRLWYWRPEVAITGSSDTGKSMLAQDILSEGMAGPLALYGAGVSEASIRQHMKHHSKFLILDEFEQNKHRPAVLELLRNSARGTNIYKGTSDQKGVVYLLRHIPWVVAIELGLSDQADANRFIILELNEIPPEARGKFMPPPPSVLRDLGLKLMVSGLVNYHRAVDLAGYLKGLQFPGVPGRVVESFSVPCGLYFSIHGYGQAEAAEAMGLMLKEWDFGMQRIKDEENLLSGILTSEVWLEGGQRQTVSQLLGSSTPTPEQVSALQRVGIRRVRMKSRRRFVGDAGPTMLFIHPETVKKQLLFRGPYASLQLDQFLTRIRGSERTRQRLGGSEAFEGVVVPMDEVARIFQGDDDREDDDNGFT